VVIFTGIHFEILPENFIAANYGESIW